MRATTEETETHNSDTAAARKAAAGLLANFGNLATAFLAGGEDDITPLFADAVLKARDSSTDSTDSSMKPICHSSCRAIKPADLKEQAKPWIHVAKRGEFPGTIDIPAGYDVPGYGLMEAAMSVEGMTVFNDETMDSMAQSFREQVLIDYEHFSSDKDKHTEAAGWGLQLRHSEDRNDLELQTDWARPAREKIIDQVYRHISPEFSGSVRYEDGQFKFYPTTLTGAGLTNRPKLKSLRPISANSGKTTGASIMPNTKAFALLCKILGVPESTSEQEIEAKAAAFLANAVTSKNRDTKITELETENRTLREEAIDRDLMFYSDVIGEAEADKQHARELLQMNRAAAVKFFDRARANAGGDGSKPRVFQREHARPPDGSKFFGDSRERNASEQRALVAKIQNREKCGFSTAWTIAKAENPGLF